MNRERVKPQVSPADIAKVTFATEQALVEAFVLAAGGSDTPWLISKLIIEFYYGDGWSDVVLVVDGEVVAVEAKLTKWRDALHQAYRNTSFAHRSYVCLPHLVADRAARQWSEFDRRGVGLCTVRDGQVVIVRVAPPQQPLSLSAVGGHCSPSRDA